MHCSFHYSAVLIQTLFNQVNPTEVSELFFEGDLAKMAALQVSDKKDQHETHTHKQYKH